MVDPATVVQMVRRCTASYEGSAMRFWREGRWRDLSYSELGEEVFEIARGLIALGLRPGERVSILSATRAEWTLADLGALCAGAVVAPIYHSNSPEECRYVLEHAGTRVVFCEDAEQLAKVATVRAQCPLLEHVITANGGDTAAISLDELRHRGRDIGAGELERIAAAVTPEDVASIVYTSGTTGPPKGCIITHANLMRTAGMYERQIQLGPGSVVLMFLPLAHLLARVTQMVVLDVGGTIAYWRGDTRTLPADLKSARPTHLPTVPRVLEKIHSEALSRSEAGGRLRRAVFRRAIASGRRVRTLQDQGPPPGRLTRLRFGVADRLVLSKVRHLFGPDLELVLTGAAPISEEVLEFFDAGDDRPYLVAALALDPDRVRALASLLGVEPKLSQMATDSRVHAHLAGEVERINERFARVEQVKGFAILDREISQETGELTPTQKAKRAVVDSRFNDVIDSLYD